MKIKCPQFEGCSAPLCPMQENSLKHGIWYPDEDICGAKKFQAKTLIKKQKLVAKASASVDKFFTAQMLETVKQIRKGIEGIDPDQSLEQADKAIKKWISEKGGSVVAKQRKKSGSVVANNQAKLSRTGKKTRKKEKRAKT